MRADSFSMPTAMGDTMSCASGPAHFNAHGAGEASAARNEGRKAHAKRRLDSRQKGKHGRIAKKSREWVLLKKEGMRRQGREVRE